MKSDYPQGSEAWHVAAQKVHKPSGGMSSCGPNESWLVDGHDKLVIPLRIGIYSIVDKYSRKILSLYALPKHRLATTPAALYLLLVKKLGGM